MSYMHPALAEHLRKRWERADAYRFAAPGTPEAKGPSTLHPWAEVARAEEAKAAAEQAEREALRADIEQLHRLVKDLRIDLALRRLRLKYSPDQPRVPAGSGRESGRWTDGGGSGTGRDDGRSTRNTGQAGQEARLHEEDAAARPKGHHYVPKGLYEKLPLSQETRKVFDDATTGRLYDIRSNRFDNEHRVYSRAVEEKFEQFIKSNNIAVENMTPDQARSFVKEVIGSTDARIRDFNMRIQIREIMRRVLPRRSGEE
jgi:polyhydroxyalkanoate synthesis regulator phasin